MKDANEPAQRLAHDLARAILAAASGDPKVEACRARLGFAGFEIEGSLEAMIASAIRIAGTSNVRLERAACGTPQSLALTASDIRLLRSLRIAVDKATEPV